MPIIVTQNAENVSKWAYKISTNMFQHRTKLNEESLVNLQRRMMCISIAREREIVRRTTYSPS